jgi:hypothetical protein
LWPQPHYTFPETAWLTKSAFVKEDRSVLEGLEESLKKNWASSSAAGAAGAGGVGGEGGALAGVEGGAAASSVQDKAAAAGEEVVVGTAAAGKQVDAGAVAAGKEAAGDIAGPSSSSGAAAAAGEGATLGGCVGDVAQAAELTEDTFTQQVHATLTKRMGRVE